MSESIKDLVIIGGGPAGLSASIYAARALLDSVTLEQEAVGGQVILTSEVDNYPGIPHTDGFTLTDAMKQQAQDLGATIVMDNVKSLSHDDSTGIFTVVASSATYRARALIVAGGATPRHIGFEGESTFAGHGVSYCATCDGMFYRNKRAVRTVPSAPGVASHEDDVDPGGAGSLKGAQAGRSCGGRH